MLDVGANVGMITLFASRLVGSSGRIESFEPNPDCVRRLEDNLRLNDIRNVVIHPAALAEAPSRMTLRLQTSRTAPSRHSGTGTLAPVEESADDVIVGEYPVDVARGDDVVGADTRHAVSVIKLDVEGFELNALKGLHETLARWGPAVITEYMDEHLARAGASRGELRAWMEGLGYEAFAFYTRRRGLRHSLMVEEVARAERAGVHINDVLWLQPRHAQYRRFASGGGMTARTSS
jgi:FkbM family methyltransferase